MNDDELDQALRTSRPDYTRTAELDPQAEAHLAQLIANDVSPVELPRRTRRSHRLAWAVSAAAAVLAIGVVGGTLVAVTPRASYAATPAMPQFTHVDGAAAPLLEGLANRAANSAPTASPEDPIKYQTWILSTDVGADGKILNQVVQPQEVTVTPGSPEAHVVIIAGKPYAPDGAVAPDAGVDPGTVLSEYSVAAPLSAPPRDASSWPNYLEVGLGIPNNAPASDVLLNLPGLLDFWSLDPAQSAALLTYLASLPDLDVAGSTTDRLGRAGIAFHGPAVRDGWQPAIVISPESGRVLAIETLWVGSTRTDVPSPSVIEYTLWK
jgi:hypothetical protein